MSCQLQPAYHHAFQYLRDVGAPDVQGLHAHAAQHVRSTLGTSWRARRYADLAMASRLDPIALYGVPVVAGLITGAVLLGSASERPAFGSRVYTYVAPGATQLALRVHTRQHVRGSYADFAAPLTVTVSSRGEAVGRAEAEGAAIADVVVPLSRPADGPLDVLVEARGVELARTTIDLAEPLTAVEPSERSREQNGARVSVSLDRGFAVPELPERLVISAQTPPGAPPELELKATGADIGKPAAPETTCTADGCDHRWGVVITPRAPAAELDVALSRDGTELVAWSGPIDVVPGRMWIDPNHDGELRIRSAVPRDEAYVSLLSPTGRFWGGRVALSTDDGGASRGAVALPELPKGSVVALVSGEPNEPETSSAPWPLRGEPLAGGRVQLVGDGMPVALRAEKERRQSARRPAYALIVAAGIFELFYLFWRTRRSRRRLEVHLAQHTGGEVTAAQSFPLTALVLLSGALALAFAILATLSAFG